MQILSCHSLVAKSEQKRSRPGSGVAKFLKFFKKILKIFLNFRANACENFLKNFKKFFRAREGVFSRERANHKTRAYFK